jgi:hypothetical protein
MMLRRRGVTPGPHLYPQTQPSALHFPAVNEQISGSKNLRPKADGKVAFCRMRGRAAVRYRGRSGGVSKVVQFAAAVAPGGSWVANMMTMADGLPGFFAPNPWALLGLGIPLGSELAGYYSTKPKARSKD